MLMLEHEKLTDDERSRISVNHCVRGAELDAARALADAAEPGEWRVEEVGGLRCGKCGGKNLARAEDLSDHPGVFRCGDCREVVYDAPGPGYRLVRYSDRTPRPPLMKRESFAFAAAARRIVPRLLDGIAVLEREVRSAWTSATIAKRELREERDRHDATIKRQAEGKTGPEYELELLAKYVTLSAAGNVGLTGEMPPDHETRRLGAYTRYLLARWAGGASIAAELSPDAMTRAKREVDERMKFRAEEDAKTEDLRRQLREAIEKVARGEVPEVLKPALREAKKRAKAGG